MSVVLTLSLVMGTALSVGVAAVAPTAASAAPTCPCSLWSDSTTPAVVDSNDAHAVELGVQFSSSTSGFISGVRFYKAAANTGEHIGSLWQADGTLLAQATFSNETGSGWQQVTFSQPVAIAANTLYVAGYHTDTGHYSQDEGYFSGGPYTNDPLTAPGNGSDPNGVFAYSPTPTFPTGTFNGTNYWVDVVYSQTAPTSPPPATSLWGPNATPAMVDSNDGQAVELGVQFSSSTSGFISGVRFYKAAANTGEHIGSLWQADGTLLAQATFSNETGSGWQQVTFSQPVAIAANTLYVAGYHTDTGHYSQDEGYFTNNGYLNAPLSAPGGPNSPNGVFTYSPTPTFPSNTFNGTNYWVDVVFSPRPIPVSVQVTAPQTVVPAGQSEQLTATETLSDGTTTDVTSQATWSSSSPGVATVAPGGLLSAVAKGQATISASIAGLTGSVGVSVVSPVAFFLITPPIVVLRAGQKTQLGVTAWLTDGSRLSVTALVRWGTVFGNSASVSPTGLLAASRAGVAIISASLGRSTTYGLVLAF
jgi:hypothetical protein